MIKTIFNLVFCSIFFIFLFYRNLWENFFFGSRFQIPAMSIYKQLLSATTEVVYWFWETYDVLNKTFMWWSIFTQKGPKFKNCAYLEGIFHTWNTKTSQIKWSCKLLYQAKYCVYICFYTLIQLSVVDMLRSYHAFLHLPFISIIITFDFFHTFKVLCSIN